MSNDITLANKHDYPHWRIASYTSRQAAEQVAASIPTVWGDYGAFQFSSGWTVARLGWDIDLVRPHLLTHGMIWSMTQLAKPPVYRPEWVE